MSTTVTFFGAMFGHAVPQAHADGLVVVASVLQAIAARVVVQLCGLTLGPHPYQHVNSALEGELALLDWSKGGLVAATGAEAIELFLAASTPLRALGAAMLTSARYDRQLSDDLPMLSGLALAAQWIVKHQPGGPADECLRWGLAARQVALDALGADGYRIPERVRHSHRPEQRLGLEPADQWTLDGLVHLQLRPADRAALTPNFQPRELDAGGVLEQRALGVARRINSARRIFNESLDADDAELTELARLQYYKVRREVAELAWLVTDLADAGIWDRTRREGSEPADERAKVKP